MSKSFNRDLKAVITLGVDHPLVDEQALFTLHSVAVQLRASRGGS